MTTAQDKVAQYLHEAHAMELALSRTLQAHAAMTPTGEYRSALDRHRRDTQRHADAVARRLRELGRSPGIAETAYGVAQRLAGQAISLAMAPLDMVRGSGGEEKLLKNAKDECATEALEIATYDALEVVARAAGDEETVAIARRHRAEEERMLAGLREEIPRLAAAVTGEQAGPAEPAPATNGRASRDDDPLPGYDTLSAGQVIARLPDLSAERLRAVAERERAGRARSTVLARVDLLLQQADGSAARDLGR
jgi:ferritin-like metal-binding protein YciE